MTMRPKTYSASPPGPPGATGAQGLQGNPGANGPGVLTGGTTGQVLRKVSATDFDTEWATPSSGGLTKGTAVLNFGAFPGVSDVSVAVTGQSGIVSGSAVSAWLSPVATADHSADEHLVETLRVVAGNIVAGTGFTVYGLNTSQLNEPGPVCNERFRDSKRQPFNDGKGTRIYGQWTVAWTWA